MVNKKIVLVSLGVFVLLVLGGYVAYRTVFLPHLDASFADNTVFGTLLDPDNGYMGETVAIKVLKSYQNGRSFLYDVAFLSPRELSHPGKVDRIRIECDNLSPRFPPGKDFVTGKCLDETCSTVGGACEYIGYPPRKPSKALESTGANY